MDGIGPGDCQSRNSTYWTNFAKRGDPNGAGLPEWPRFTDAKMATMHFNEVPQAGAAPNVEKIKALDAYFAWRRTPEGAAWVQSQFN